MTKICPRIKIGTHAWTVNHCAFDKRQTNKRKSIHKKHFGQAQGTSKRNHSQKTRHKFFSHNFLYTV